MLFLSKGYKILWVTLHCYIYFVLRNFLQSSSSNATMLGFTWSILTLLGIVCIIKFCIFILIDIYAGLKAYIYPLVFKSEDFRTKFGEWCLVTGCTQGIGREYALELAARGMDVVLLSRNKESLEEVQKDIETIHNVRTKVIVVDFADATLLPVAVKQVQDMNLDLGIIGKEHF